VGPSVLEHHACAVAVSLLSSPRHNVLGSLPLAQARELRGVGGAGRRADLGVAGSFTCLLLRGVQQAAGPSAEQGAVLSLAAL